jgi:putative N6-adenine-specific DNA methylase
VAGGSGTVEILAHLRFAGRPESMPKPGERRPARSEGKKSAPTTGILRWFAVASPGLEKALCDELGALSQVHEARAVDGGVEFSGGLDAGMAANLHSRIATRIVVRLGEVKARDFAPFRRGLEKLPWKSFIPAGRPMRVDVSTTHCRLFHTGALAEQVELAAASAVGKLPKREKKADGEADEDCTRILLRGQDDRFMVSVDSSGELLHRRGWRLEAGRAPLRETLAAGVLALCDYDPEKPLVDPMCGAGTIAIEAAARARGIAPGSDRSFAFERWPSHDATGWNNLSAGAAKAAAQHAPIVALDRDGKAVEIARRNAERAGVEVQLSVAAFGEGAIPPEPGLVVLNPPYGHRLGDRRHALRLGRAIGQTLRQRFVGWRAGVLCPDSQFVAAVAAGARQKAISTVALRNGGLRILLAQWKF